MLKFFFKNLAKRSQLSGRNRGFTFIELLVTLVISSIVLGALLTFMNNMLTSERQEQAKATTEQEIQAALDYIARDLQEAVYIYNGDGVAAIKSQLPNSTATDRVPVLVFWKRSFFPSTRELTNTSVTPPRVGCLVKLPPANTDCDNRDYFVYSLVAYYLIYDNDSTWSKVARIGRWEIQDGIKNPYNSSIYLINADPNFKLFDLNLAGNLPEKMNLWKNASNNSSNYDLNKNKVQPLVDYVDQNKGAGFLAPVACDTTSSDAQLVPKNNTIANPLEIYSFYACVDSTKTLARVYLRGNALARIKSNATYTDTQDTYFPTANVQVQGRKLRDGE